MAVTNDGDTAFEIKAGSNKKIGRSSPVFENKIARLSRNEEAFFPINIILGDGSGLLGGLFEEMQKWHVSELPFVLRYRDSKRRHYKTTFRFVVDVSVPAGITISEVHSGRSDIFWFLRRD